MFPNLKARISVRINAITEAIRQWRSPKDRVAASPDGQPIFSATGAASSAGDGLAQGTGTGASTSPRLDLRRLRPAPWLIGLVLVGAGAWAVVRHPPLQTLEAGEMGVRTNHLTGSVSQWREGSVLVIPALHDFARFSLRDQTWRAEAMSKADGAAPLQSVEGLSLGVDLTVRYAIDPARLAQVARAGGGDLQRDVVEPALQGIVYKTFARYTVREIFSSKRPEILQGIETELKARLAADGLILKGVNIGKVDLPADYRRGMDTLLAEELATQKMRYTLELKDKRVKETELDAEAEKVRREKAAEAAGREQIIAARAQEEAMKHVLPFKQRQIEQRQLEAEAEKVAAIRRAEGTAQARRVEASGEADSRQKLADAEIYRLEKVNKVSAEQMAREGALITKHPLLIQKAMADKLSDKVQVIIAPPSRDGFIGSGLIGALGQARGNGAQGDAAEDRHAAAKQDKDD